MWVIDFEASGLSKKSYPIEVGLTNGIIEYSALIKPLPHWQYWDWLAQSVHRIPRHKILSAGQAAEDVANELNKRLAGEVVYCDSIEWDGFWLNVLFTDIAMSPKFEILDIKELLISDDKAESYFEEKARLEMSGEFRSHSALDDARVIRQSLTA